ncbi:MAG: biotin--[acetyl-CoA-carboxylase] ligase [Polyangiaceae bacterium]|nr:biotin--[acetyl-CoA-carboxylase] ligase [Polyangiaceae bacterium]
MAAEPVTRSPFDVARFAAERAARAVRLGAPLRYAPTTGSTNDDALAAAREGEPEGALFVSDEQRAGRGRRGAGWVAPPRAHLMFSLVLRPRVPPDRLSTLALATGLAVREACARYVTSPLRVKWPNDVELDGRKLAGILIESSGVGTARLAVVVGVGVNVARVPWPPELTERATSLEEAGARVEREALLAEVLAALERRVAVWEAQGLEASRAELAAADALRGEAVTVEGVSGIAAGIAPDGALLIATPEGVVRVVSGHVVRAGTRGATPAPTART